jgi:hypothetical protein
MGEEQLLAKAGGGTFGRNLSGDAAERAEAFEIRGTEGERDQGGAAGLERQTELLRQFITEGGGTHLGYGEAAGGDDQPGATKLGMGGADEKVSGEASGALDFGDPLREEEAHAGRAALLLQHVHDLRGGTVAEELPQRLLVIGDAVLFDQRNEVRGGIAGQGRPGEVWIGGEEVFRGAVKIGEVAAASTGDQDLLADAFRVFDQGDATSPLRGYHCAHQAGGAGAEHQYIEAVFRAVFWAALWGLRGHFSIMTALRFPPLLDIERHEHQTSVSLDLKSGWIPGLEAMQR